jgi:flagellar protein FlgJ
MLRPDFPAARGIPATSPTASLAWQSAQAGGRGGAFAQVFTQVHAEIDAVIEKGWPQGGNPPALNIEGMLRRTGLQGPLQAEVTGNGDMPVPQQEFIASIAPWAKEAGAALGVSPELVAAHAALESGWGQRPLRDASGRDSHNLFGIKARGWDGARIDALTTEVEDGTALKKVESFRSYPNHASAFRDYAKLLRDNPRFRGALNAGEDAAAFAQGLARGGYATDPNYAAKLTRLATQLQSLD